MKVLKIVFSTETGRFFATLRIEKAELFLDKKIVFSREEKQNINTDLATPLQKKIAEELLKAVIIDTHYNVVENVSFLLKDFIFITSREDLRKNYHSIMHAMVASFPDSQIQFEHKK